MPAMSDESTFFEHEREILHRASYMVKHEPLFVIHMLDDLLDRMDKAGSNLSLSPKWRDIWAKVPAKDRDRSPLSVLERIENAIRQISVLDDEVTEIRLQQEDRVCLLLGAGASAPAPSSIPTVARMLPELWRRARKIGREDVDRLADWCDKQGVRNIEDLLTAAYIANYAAKNGVVTSILDYFLFSASSESVEDIRPQRGRIPTKPDVDVSSIALLQDTLQVLFGLLTGTMLPAEPNAGHSAIASFVRKHSNCGIVTTNYDGCIDEAMSGDSVQLNTYVDESKAPSQDAIDLVKMHGSINWTYCDSCHEVKEFDLLELKRSYHSDSHSFAVIGICKNCGGQRRPLLIPPIGFKFVMFPNLIRLWNKAREVIEQAKYLIVVGYSFSEADTYVNKIVERSMTINNAQKIIICDTNSELAPALRNRYSARIDGFDEKRIMRAVGSADKMLSQVLDSLVSDQPVPVKPNGRAGRNRAAVRSAARA